MTGGEGPGGGQVTRNARNLLERSTLYKHAQRFGRSIKLLTTPKQYKLLQWRIVQEKVKYNKSYYKQRKGQENVGCIYLGSMFSLWILMSALISFLIPKIKDFIF